MKSPKFLNLLSFFRVKYSLSPNRLERTPKESIPLDLSYIFLHLRYLVSLVLQFVGSLNLPQLGQFGVALLVHLDLGLGAAFGLFQAVGQRDQLALKVGPFAFDALPEFSLSLQILVEEAELVLEFQDRHAKEIEREREEKRENETNVNHHHFGMKLLLYILTNYDQDIAWSCVLLRGVPELWRTHTPGLAHFRSSAGQDSGMGFADAPRFQDGDIHVSS